MEKVGHSMQLYFTCPEKKEIFSSSHYSLLEGYKVVEGEERMLHGMVQLDSPCPLCGQKHQYKVEEVMCSYERKE